MTIVLGENLNNKESISVQVDAMKIPRFSYRKKFDPLEGNITSDRRWGCSIRCCQDLLAQFIKKSNILTTNEHINKFFSSTLKIHGNTSNHSTMVHSNLQNTANSLSNIPKINPEPETHGSQSTADLFTTKKAHKKHKSHDDYPEYFHLFYDAPNSPFSIHSFCCELKKLSGIKPGNWVKLSTLSVILKNLLSHSGIETIIAENGQISLPLVLDAFKKYQTNKSDKAKTPTTSNSTTDNNTRNEKPPLPQTRNSDKDDIDDNSQSQQNQMPVLILIPLMLGLKKLDDEFSSVITKALSLPKQSIGVIGGKNNKAYYIIGYTDKGDFLYFDPHEVHDAMVKQEDLYRIYEPELRKIKKMQLNSSLMIGFLVKTKEDIDEIKEVMRETPIIVSDEYIPYSGHWGEEPVETTESNQEDYSNGNTDTDYDFVIVS